MSQKITCRFNAIEEISVRYCVCYYVGYHVISVLSG